MAIKHSFRALTDVDDIANKKIVFRLLITLALGIIFQFASLLHSKIVGQGFFALPVTLLELFIQYLVEVYGLIVFLYLYFKKYGYKSWLPFALNSSNIGLFILSVILLELEVDTYLLVQNIIIALKIIILLYLAILIYKLRFKEYKININWKHPAIPIAMVIIEFAIIVSGFFYIPYKYPLVFQKKYPAVLIINIEGEVITTSGYGILEKRGQNRTNATTSSNIIRMLDFFSQDNSIKAFILEIDAFGGQTAGQEELVRYIKRMDKPVVAVIQGSALSSGYYVAAGTDKIYAQRSAKIGKIAENFVYVNRVRRGEEQVCYITSSNYRDITENDCSGFEPDVFKRLKHYVELTHKTLISHIATMRKLDVSYIESLSNDKIMTSSEALELGLIDEIGTTDDAILWLENKIGTKLWRLYLRDMLPQMAMK